MKIRKKFPIIFACALIFVVLNFLLVYYFKSPNATEVHLEVPIVSSTTLPDCLVQYQQYLQETYRDSALSYPMHTKPSEFVSRNRPKHPIDLVMIYRDINESVDSNIEQTGELLHGRVDHIQKEKISVTIKEIGTSSTGKPIAHFVLIEGAAGIGKSTLCWQLCQSWLEGRLKYPWDLVVLVEVRDETTRNASSVYDLLYHPNDTIRQSIALEVQKRKGEGLLIIFDGYDELSDYQRNELSVLEQILSDRLLQKATVLVTSRPIATGILPAKFKLDLDQRIVISGFNESDIQSYITLACKENTKLLKALRTYVSSRPFIFSVMYNPLHCTMVTELYIQHWKGGLKGFAPNTLTDLYTAFVLNILRRTLPSKISAYLNKISDLKTRKYNNLMQIAELAANGLEAQKYIFNDVTCDTLDLLVSVQHIYDVQSKRSAYRFLHLTLQEYMAAFYWSEKQQKQESFLQRQEIHSIQDLYQFGTSDGTIRTTHWTLFLFIAGLNHSLLFTAIAPPDMHDFFDYTTIYSFCQLLFEAQSPRNVREVFNQKSVSFQDKSYLYNLNQVSVHIYYFVVGYCIGNSGRTTSWFVEVPIDLVLILSDGMHYNGLVTWKETSGPSLFALVIGNKNGSVLSTGFLDVLSKLYPFTERISELRLMFKLTFGDEVVSLLHNLSYYFPRLTTLCLPHLSFPTTIELPKLQHETLKTLEITLPDYNAVLDQLHDYQALKEVHLSQINK